MLIEVLLLHRTLPAGAVIAGMTTVLKVGAVSTDLVAIEARKALENVDTEPEDDPLDQDGDDGDEGTADDGAKVISPHTKRLPPDWHQRMTPTSTAEPCAAEVPASRMPLPGDPEDATIDELCRDLPRIRGSGIGSRSWTKWTYSSAPAVPYSEAGSAVT
ncbi:hypothetical protein [Streptomyces rapamycinicus]|uniref:Uncharacterized protein n=2 Tax=Streptomyces rapamycinicus TaxID=1226757 RepID=A0A0A0NS30_STRRN|nr:hypothetical protein [Streptomyces rapamycinicus]AGP59153.1 hypothetical protein M271_38820 [Streptomyces rapamycinicus NRRL 5491]MBB4786883.1 hypothetical protein [Streptomyces rapamycinicus]RLV77662.1 hypothetical protein D3C57_104795 [Streptomyces rapamycinicus NRRL 5491]UTO66910.1 hypothetical protein LJB45_34380 [Streptomyces rapamycinicus]UTP34865.1 hypothetical protein LIV37_39510 [Streptomyces rapamycinicus NRRL 5491]